jgi:hypothetical protein
VLSVHPICKRPLSLVFLQTSLVTHHGAAPPANLAVSRQADTCYRLAESSGEQERGGGGSSKAWVAREQIWDVEMAHGSS